MGSTAILHITIPAPLGQLEGILKPASEEGRPKMAVLVCHPHPLYGGTMHNKVVFKAAQVLNQELDLPALRFNFRGIGRSSGSYDDGIGEQEDVRLALDYLAQQYPGLPILLVGFSFGAAIGLKVGARDPRVKALIGIGMPARLMDGDVLAGCEKPKFFVHGQDDTIAPLDLAQEWYAEIPGPKEMVVIPGADHFFVGKLEEMQASIQHYVEQLS